MNYGRFFILDHDTSQLQEGIAVFNYCGLKTNDVESEKKTPQYPIYLTFSKENINFRVHYFQEKDNKSKELVGEHLHNVILSLPLSANLEVKDGLTSALIDAFQTNFPQRSKDTNNNYLYDLIWESVKENIDKEQPLSYSTLSQFEIPQRIKHFSKKIENNEQNYTIDKPSINYFIRKLILDFLFDLEHTKVFQNSPYYEYLSIKLRENYFFNALANKAMFYYYRELIKAIDNCTFSDKKNEEQINKLKFYGERLFKAEKEWTKSIRNEKSDLAFHESRKWVEERNSVKWWINLKSCIISIFYPKKSDVNVPDGWFKEPEDEMDNIYRDRGINENKIYTQLLRGEKAKNSRHDFFLKKDMKNNYKLSSRWYTRKGAFSYIFSHCQNFYLRLIMLSFLVISLVDMDCHIKSFKMILSFAFLFPALLLVFYFARKKHLFGSNIFFPRLLIAILTGWITIFFGTNMLEESSLSKFVPNPIAVICTIIIMVLAIFWFTYIDIGRLNPHINICSKCNRTLYLMLISFFYSHIAGSLLFFLTKNTAPAATNLILNIKVSYDKISTLTESTCSLSNQQSINHSVILFLFTFFAMFIGIFLNMMIQEKRATEPL